jgi:hypothetical protein
MMGAAQLRSLHGERCPAAPPPQASATSAVLAEVPGVKHGRSPLTQPHQELPKHCHETNNELLFEATSHCNSLLNNR